MLGRQLKLLRESKHKSQQDVCAALNIEQSTLANYENDKRVPKLEILIKIAEYYNCSVDYLLGLTDQEVPQNSNNPHNSLMLDRLNFLLNEDDNLEFYSSCSKIPMETIQKYMTGELEPTTYDLCKLIEVLDTSADYLFGKSDEAHPALLKTYNIDDAFSRILSEELGKNYLETELADNLDVSVSHIKKLLTGECIPSPDILEKIAQLLEKSTDYLLGLSKKSREPDANGEFPFHMDTESIHRLQELLGDFQACTDWEYELGLNDDELYMMYYYGFIPHITVLQKLCKGLNVSADYLLNLSNSKLSVRINNNTNEDRLLNNYRKLDTLYQEKIMGALSEQLLQQERDIYLKSSVAADELKQAK